jgi:hypothetical protein
MRLRDPNANEDKGIYFTVNSCIARTNCEIGGLNTSNFVNNSKAASIFFFYRSAKISSFLVVCKTAGFLLLILDVCSHYSVNTTNPVLQFQCQHEGSASSIQGMSSGHPNVTSTEKAKGIWLCAQIISLLNRLPNKIVFGWSVDLKLSSNLDLTCYTSSSVISVVEALICSLIRRFMVGSINNLSFIVGNALNITLSRARYF